MVLMRRYSAISSIAAIAILTATSRSVEHARSDFSRPSICIAAISWQSFFSQIV
jgi:hypothetical protein